jgi:hypothetical protein
METKMSKGLSPDVELCAAVGLNPREMKPAEIYLMAGNIIHDRTLTQRCLKYLEGSILPGGARLRVISEMSPEEAAALRARVLSR